MKKYTFFAASLMISNCYTMDNDVRKLMQRVVVLEREVRIIGSLKDRIATLETEVQVLRGAPGAHALTLTEQAAAQDYEALDATQRQFALQFRMEQATAPASRANRYNSTGHVEVGPCASDSDSM
ncbi:MAG: hypothetical protein AB7F19_04705 [Candidatus Babeliales bacterium]